MNLGYWMTSPLNSRLKFRNNFVKWTSIKWRLFIAVSTYWWWWTILEKIRKDRPPIVQNNGVIESANIKVMETEDDQMAVIAIQVGHRRNIYDFQEDYLFRIKMMMRNLVKNSSEERDWTVLWIKEGRRLFRRNHERKNHPRSRFLDFLVDLFAKYV